MVPSVVSAVKSGAVSLMRGMRYVSAGVKVAVLMVTLLFKFGFLRTCPGLLASAACNCPGKKRQNPPVLHRVGPETFSYPHAGARVQQHCMGQIRMEIGYAGPDGAVKPSSDPAAGFSHQDISCGRAPLQRRVCVVTALTRRRTVRSSQDSIISPRL